MKSVVGSRVVLASRSPRRIELFSRIFAEFEVIPSHSEESAEAQDPGLLVRRLAEEKAEDVFSQNTDALVVGADTVVWLAGRRYGKPRTAAEAEEMLLSLSGREHSVFTGVCVRTPEGCRSFACESRVRFRKLTRDFLDGYLRTEIPYDKAGGYGIQCEPSPVESWRGDYDNIVGLPVRALRAFLEEHNLITDEER